MPAYPLTQNCQLTMWGSVGRGKGEGALPGALCALDCGGATPLWSAAAKLPLLHCGRPATALPHASPCRAEQGAAVCVGATRRLAPGPTLLGPTIVRTRFGRTSADLKVGSTWFFSGPWARPARRGTACRPLFLPATRPPRWRALPLRVGAHRHGGVHIAERRPAASPGRQK